MNSKGMRVLLALALTMSIAGCGGGSGDVSEIMSGPVDSNGWEQSADTSEILTEGKAADSDSVDESLIITVANMDISTKDFTTTSDSIDSIFHENGCLVISDSTNEQDIGRDMTRHVRSCTVKIPAESFEKVKEALLAGEWDVSSMSANRDDVTKAHANQELQLKSLQERYDWYANMVSQTEDEGVAKQYFDEMMNIAEQMDSLRGSMASMEADAAWSTLSLNIYEDVGGDGDVRRVSGVWGDLAEATYNLPMRIAEFFGGVLYVIVIMLPYVLVIGLFVFAIVKFSDFGRRFGKNKGKGKTGEAKSAPTAPEEAKAVADSDSIDEAMNFADIDNEM